MSATFKPSLAAEMAVHVPATPPPTTTRSNDPALSGTSGRRSSFRRSAARAFMSSGGRKSGSREKRIASQRPSKPVRSRSATAAFASRISTVPPCGPCHWSPAVPRTVLSGRRLTTRRNLPGAPSPFQGDAQSHVRTHTRYVPVAGNVTVVSASSTGLPIPCASSIGEPI